MSLVIADFGQSRRKAHQLNQGCFYFSQWMNSKLATKILLKEGFSGKLDVLHYGWLLCYFLDLNSKPKFEIPSNATEHQRYLIDKCLNYNPSLRPSFKSILYIIKSPADWASYNGEQNPIGIGVQEIKQAILRKESFDRIFKSNLYGKEKILLFLEKLGCNVTGVDAKGENAIHQAIRQGAKQFIPLLITLGCQINLANKDNSTPIDVATQLGFADIVSILSKYL